MRSLGPNYTAPAVSHCGIPDRKPPDKTNENAGPVGAGTGVEKKSLAQRLHFYKSNNILLNRQDNCREAAAFESGARSGPSAKKQQQFRTVDPDAVCEQDPQTDDDHWQPIGSVIDRVLAKGGAI